MQRQACSLQEQKPHLCGACHARHIVGTQVCQPWHPFVRGAVPSGRSSALIFVPPRWSCRPMRKLCLCHPRRRRGTQRLPHTPRCDSARPQSRCREGQGCLATHFFFALVAPVAWESHPADVRTICLCTPRWPAFPVGPGRRSPLGQPFRLKDSLGLSKIRSNNTWLILISFDVCLNNWSFSIR